MEPRPNIFMRFFSIVIPWALLITGLFMLPLQIMKKDLSKIPGDMGDARFNNYILEHGFQYMTGTVSDYWDAPFMYPYKNTIAMSDNLLGTLPFYAFFRQTGASRETAFQLWILVLFALNYLCCYFVLKKWTLNPIIAACGAYIFAFGIYNIGQLFHAQVFPRFIAPLTIYWLFRYFNTKAIKYLVLCCAGLVYQFYCGIYLGFLLLYCIIFLKLAYLLVYRKQLDFSYLTVPRNLITHIGVISVSILLLIPLFKPYMQISEVVGFRSWEAIFASIPRFRSYFFTSPASTLWTKVLYEHSAYRFEGWWNHFLFMGALPWLAIAAVPFVMIRKTVSSADKKLIGAITLALFLVFIFCFRANSFSLWKVINLLPGFASMRSLDRLINIEAFLFVAVFVLVASQLIKSSKSKSLILFLLPFITVADNLIKPEEHKSFKKADAIAQVAEVKNIINDSRLAPGQVVAFNYIWYDYPNGTTWQNYLAEIHMNAMLASQELGIPCVNGYSGFEPGNYSAYFHQPNQTTLINWLAFNEADYSKVIQVTGMPSDIVETRYINLKASNGSFLCSDESASNLILANRPEASTWETFLLIRMKNGKSAILAHNNLYFSSDLGKHGQLSATKKRVYDWELFEIVSISENRIAIKASNSKFLVVNSSTNQLEATSEFTTPETYLELIYKN